MPDRYMFVFGSLLRPTSLRRTLPDVQLDDCLTAVCRGYHRAFTVAFPNDGSQRDKAYVDAAGGRPEIVLFADLRPSAGSVNGVCVPVSARELESLVQRELRYDAVDVGEAVQFDAGSDRFGPVLAFLGKPRFTDAKDVARGVVPADYLQSMNDGASHWDDVRPGFWEHYLRSTHFPPEAAIQELIRIDRPA
jgi:cation transport regulator ChaC